MSPLAAASVLCLCLLPFLYLWKHLSILLQLRRKVGALGIPTITGPPLLGNSLDLLKVFARAPGVPFSVYTLQLLQGFRVALKDHSLFTYSIGPTLYIALTRADDVETLLSSNKEVNKSPDYDLLQDWLGTGLITSSYLKWKKHRKMLTPSFHFRILDEFQPVVSKYSRILVKRLSSKVDNAYFHIDPFITDCAMDIIAGTSLGVDIKAQEEESPYVKALHSLSPRLFARICSPWLWSDALFYLSPMGWRASKDLKTIARFVRQVIADKKKELANYSEEEIKNIFEGGSEKRKICRAFLELMILHNILHKDDQFSDQDIEDEVNTFGFAGHDTTSSGMIWTLYLLGLYPEIQEKVHEELDYVFGADTTRDITLQDVKQLAYIERVIKESQRLFPPVPMIARKMQEDFLLRELVIPKGTTVSVLPAVLHQDPEVFPDPERFDPDRFLDLKRHPFAYVPFSAGPRNCIGQRFAMLEMKTVIADVMRNYKVTSLDPRDKVLPCSDFVCKPSQPIRVKIQFRT